MVETIRNLMMVPGSSDVIDFVDGRVKLVGITVKPDSPFVGRKLLSFKGVEGKLLVGAIVRSDQVFIPHGEDTIQADDLIYLVARTDELNNVFSFFDIKNEGLRRVIIVGAGQTGPALKRIAPVAYYFESFASKIPLNEFYPAPPGLYHSGAVYQTRIFAKIRI